jgi:PadR family transcriptional regulator
MRTHGAYGTVDGIKSRTRSDARSVAARREEPRWPWTLDTGLFKAYIVDIMTPPLGEFEVVVLLAVLQLGTGAFGSAVHEEIQQRTRRGVSRGSTYVTLDRLAEKGLLVSRLDDATPARGGRRKRLFRVTATGLRAVKQSVATFARMQEGLAPLLSRR